MGTFYQIPYLVNEDISLKKYLNEISKHKPLSAEEEKLLAAKIKKGDKKALDKLVKSNLRFVVSVCRNYQNQGLPLADLINEGNLGLIKAAQRFDEKKNFKFISYAVWWIRQAILQALAEQSRIVKLPLNRVGMIHKIGKAQSKLEQKYSRNPNINEIAKELSVSEKDISDTMKIGNTHMSLYTPLTSNNSDNSKLLDLIADERCEKPDDTTSYKSTLKEIELLLSNLTQREKIVIKMYYGIGEDISHTLEEIGIRLNLTRERVRQIKEKALRKLRTSQHIYYIMDH